MDRIKNVYQSLSEKELKEAVLEIASKNETGIYKSDGILRRVQREIRDIIGGDGMIQYSIEAVVNGVTWEISRRWYNGFYGITEKMIEE